MSTPIRDNLNSDDEAVVAVMLQLGGSGGSPAAPPGADPLQLLSSSSARSSSNHGDGFASSAAAGANNLNAGLGSGSAEADAAAGGSGAHSSSLAANLPVQPLLDAGSAAAVRRLPAPAAEQQLLVGGNNGNNNYSSSANDSSAIRNHYAANFYSATAASSSSLPAAASSSLPAAASLVRAFDDSPTRTAATAAQSARRMDTAAIGQSEIERDGRRAMQPDGRILQQKTSLDIFLNNRKGSCPSRGGDNAADDDGDNAIAAIPVQQRRRFSSTGTSEEEEEEEEEEEDDNDGADGHAASANVPTLPPFAMPHANEEDNGGRPSTAPARIIGLSIQTDDRHSAIGNDSIFDDGSLSSPRPRPRAAPFNTAPSRLERGSYDSSDDDLTPVLTQSGSAEAEAAAAAAAQSSATRGAAMENDSRSARSLRRGRDGTGLLAEDDADDAHGPSDGGGSHSAHSSALEEAESKTDDSSSKGGSEYHPEEESDVPISRRSSLADSSSAFTAESIEENVRRGGGMSRSHAAAATAATATAAPSAELSMTTRTPTRRNGRGQGSKEPSSVSPSLRRTSSRKPAAAPIMDESAESTDESSSLSYDAREKRVVAAHCVIPGSGGTKVAAPDGEELWAIDRILGRRYNPTQSRVEYLIVWRGYEKDPSENTWEPAESLSIPSLNFVQRRWGDTKPSSAEIEMTDPDLDEERVEAYLEWEKESRKAKKSPRSSKKKAQQSPKKKKASPKKKNVAALLGGEALAFGDGMADTRSFVKQTLLELVRKVRRKVDQYGFFSGPVDPVKSQCLDYYDIIDKENEAMDLDTVEGMILKGTLVTVDDFETNLKRIVHCCRKYNTNPENFVRLEGEKIESLAAPLIDVAKRAINKRLAGSCEEGASEPAGTAASAATGVGRSRRKRSHNETQAESDTAPVRRRPKRGRTAGKGKSHIRSNDQDDGSSFDSSHGIDQEILEDESSGGDKSGRSKRRRRSNDYTPTPERSSSRSATSGKKAFGADDSSVVAKRPTRATRKTVNYSESARKKGDGGDDESYSDMSASVTSRSSKLSRPKLDRNKYRDPEIEGSEVPPCKKDLSTSTLKMCTLRKEWLSIVPEMMNVCNEAARRSTLDADPDAERYEKPLSDVYMTERLEYDAIVTGHTVRTKVSPEYLQGFIVVTDFQVWRRTFRWATSNEPAAGITPTNIRLRCTDADGSLTAELQNVKTRGSDTRDGIVFERVAEIALLGGLRCGGKLVKTALLELRQSRKYDYVVLQATKIAIPFYERMGFRRVGAVTRFKDDPNLPEVPYRHWSEIVGNEAMEASYMMALRLKEFSIKSSSASSSAGGKLSLKNRKAESIVSLRSAYSLLSDAIFLRATGSKTYVHTLRELLATANDFAKCAGDEEMISAIKRATEECTTTKIGGSKKILRDELDLPAGKSASRSSSLTSSSSLSDADCGPLEANASASSSSRQSGYDDEQFCDVKVSVRVDGDLIANDSTEEGDLHASVSEFSGLLPREIGVTVRLGRAGFEPEDEEEGDSLFASLHLPRTRKNIDEVNAATAIALQCLRDTLRDGAFLEGANPSHFPSVMPGEIIMIRVLARDNNLMWLPAKVKRHCKEHELPDDDDATIHNSFIVKTVEEGTIEEFSRILDPARRGVGRDWCTNIDWYSFQAMPPAVLDELLVGSWVEYPGENGARRAGFIEERIGHGLQSDAPHWRLVTYDRRDREETFEYTAAALKEAVTITDKSLRAAAVVLRNLPPMAFDQGSFDMATKRLPSALARVDPQDIDAWVQNRLDGCNLEIGSEKSKKQGPGKGAKGRKRRRNG